METFSLGDSSQAGESSRLRGGFSCSKQSAYEDKKEASEQNGRRFPKASQKEELAVLEGQAKRRMQREDRNGPEETQRSGNRFQGSPSWQPVAESEQRSSENPQGGATCQPAVDSDASERQRSSEKASTSDASVDSSDSRQAYNMRRSHRLKFLAAVKHRIKRAFSFSLPRANALEEVVSGLKEANGGQPVPETLKQDIKVHFERLPVRYAEGFFQPDEVLLHMRLLHEVSEHSESSPLLNVSSFQTYSGFLSLLSTKKVKKRLERRGFSLTLERKLPGRNLSLNDLVSAIDRSGGGVPTCSSESPSESGFSPSEASVSSDEDFLGEDVDSETVMHSVVFADVQHIDVEDLTLILRKRGLKVKKARGYLLSTGLTLGMLLLKGGVAHDLRSSIRGAFKETKETAKTTLKIAIPNPKALKMRTASEGRLAPDDSPRWDFGEIERWVCESGLDGNLDEETQKTVRGIESMMSGKGPMGRWLLDRRKLDMGEKFADGASGEVYRALYKGEEVAVKVLRGRFGSSAQGKTAMEFRREVAALSLGHHKNLLPFYGVCMEGKQLCIVTKFMAGGNLADFLAKHGPLPMPKLLQVARDVAEGMRCLHKNGVIHRDLKTANILLDVDGTAKVADFGVARLRFEKDEMTKEVGTYRWMAPEALGAFSASSPVAPVTQKSDIYSYGIVLWELLTGGVPYTNYSPLQAAVGVALNNLRPPIPDKCDPALRSLMQRAWDKDPWTRPELTEIVAELDALILKQTLDKSKTTAHEAQGPNGAREKRVVCEL